MTGDRVLRVVLFEFEESDRMEELFTEKEVRVVLLELGGDKAPSPDNFPMAF